MSRQLPASILAGDTFLVAFNATPYSAADGYDIHFKLTGPSGSPERNSYQANANTNSTSHFDIRVEASQTANLTAGYYTYAVVAQSNTNSFTIEHGNIQVEARADLISGSDLRSHNLRVYEAICAVIENRATTDQQSYSIAGRQLTRIPVMELLALKNHYKELVSKEAGKTRRKLYTRFY